MKKDSVYIAQMLDAISKIRRFTAGMDRESFSEDDKTQSAVIMQLALIGELTKRISSAAKERINVPWKDIAGFRDKAIHDYYQVDLDIVWGTIVSDIGVLESALRGYKDS